MKRAEIKLAIQDIMATTMEKHRDNHRVVNGGRVAGAALSVIKMIFTWAIREELADKNPAQTLQPPARYRTRERVLSDAEWRGLCDALTTQDGRAKVGVTEPTAISVLLCAAPCCAAPASQATNGAKSVLKFGHGRSRPAE
jgi:site-specific recombinase XerD